jgi:hypothetical protein
MNRQEIERKVFCEGVWKHKYNEARNQKMEELTGEPNDRTAYDVGIEMEIKTNHE